MNKTAVLAVRIISDAKGANAGFDQTSAKVSRLSGVGMLAKAGLLAAGAAVVAYGAKAVGMAGDLQQSVGAIDTVFGKSAAKMHTWADGAATAVGLTKNEYNELGTLIGTQLANGGTAMDKLAPKTNNLIELGADLSSMFGGSTKDAVGALSSALKGERDPIERYGVSLNQAKIDAKAAELGFRKVGGSLSTEGQQAATLALIMEQTSKAHGNFARETDTMAHQQQVAAAQWDNLATSLGTLLLPVLTMVMTFFNSNVMPILTQGAGVAKTLSEAIGGRLAQAWARLTDPAGRSARLLAGAQGTMAGLSEWVTTRLMPALTGLAGTLTAAFNKVAPIVTAVVDQITTGMAPALPIVHRIFGTIGDIITGVLGLVGAYVTNVVTTITTIWQQWGPQIVGVLTTVWTAILNVIGPALDTIKAVIATVTAALRGDWTGVWNGLKGIVANAWATIVAAVRGAADILKSVLALAWSVITKTASEAITKLVGVAAGIKDKILGALAGAGNWLLSTGRNLIEGLWNGINDKVNWIRNKIAGFVGSVERWFKDFFGIHSPSRMTHALGLQLPAGLAQGITAAGGLITAAWQAVTAGLTVPAVSFAAGQIAGHRTTAPIVQHITIEVHGPIDRHAAAREIRDLLNGEARFSGRVSSAGTVI